MGFVPPIQALVLGVPIGDLVVDAWRPLVVLDTPGHPVGVDHDLEGPAVGDALAPLLPR